MFANYFTIAWRNIIKRPLFSAINIIGLAIGLMSCLLIMLFVRSESGYDTWLPDSERIARLHTAYTMPGRPPFLTVRSAGRVMPALRDYLTNEIEAGVRLVSWGTTILKDGQGFSDGVIFADQDLFNVIDLPLVHGTSASSFNKPNDLLVTEETAIRYFGRTDVVGETLTLCCMGDQPVELAISGVLKDLPENTHLNLSLLVYMDVALFSTFPGVLETWNSVNVFSYFKLREGISLAQTQTRINYWLNNESPYAEQFKEFMGTETDMKVTDGVKLKLMGIEDIYLKARKDAGSMGDFKTLGDEKMVFTFTLVAFLILLIACINFMNLSTARAGQRAKEVAMRKVLGASRQKVATQFLFEATALVFISMLIALVAVEIALPYYNEILNKSIAFDLLKDPQLLGAIFTIVILVGLGAGSYPALVLSRYLPGQILKASKSNDSEGSAKLRSALVVIQFAVSIGLLICTSVVYLQTKHANEIDLGYNKDQKLVLNIGPLQDNRDSLKQELEALPVIDQVVFSSEVPSQDFENNTNFTRPGVDGNEPISELLNYHNMDFGFFETYDVEPVAGRLFDESYGTDIFVPATEEQAGKGGAILNMSAVRKLGFDTPEQAIGVTLRQQLREGTSEITIVGVIPDIYFRSIKFDVRPSIYLLNKARLRVATITYSNAGPVEVRKAIEDIWTKLAPMQPIDLQFLNEMIESQYRQEVAQMRLFSAFAVLAVIVACLGLYGLAAFSAERRTKEIGIRKVMGASVKDIIMLLIWQFSRPVLLANVLAWPVAVWLMLSWLEQFPQRIDLVILLPICIFAAVVSVLIAWLTVGGNAARVAAANPIGALRHE
ncbi:ABC transporter permease [Alteromonas sediminis]|uniref:ABC transporter permease n=1 Tax=Alteromonas sediminis TaxID=2259342 RepID=A0A3N5Z632_9ALTE|nr:ABC transporter permease [Alteromonas sediminis]RPJ65924.1 ABC transporter permease [Alteromonas sediminis]